MRSANLLTIKATNADRQLVARIANEYARQFVAFRRRADRRTVREAQRRSAAPAQPGPAPAQRSSGPCPSSREPRARAGSTRSARCAPSATSCSKTTQELSTEGTLDQRQRRDRAAGLDSGRAQLARAGADHRASGLGLGLLLGIGLALLFELFDSRLRDPSEIERRVPAPDARRHPAQPRPGAQQPHQAARHAASRARLGAGEMEAFHMLRANLRYFEADRAIKSVVVTSAAPGEGKSTVAWNLAAANANAGNRVLLIEAELRRPTLVREFKLQSSQGLVQILADGAEPVRRDPPRLGADPKQRRRWRARHDGRDRRPAASRRTPPTCSTPSRMAELIRTCEQEYDLVVIDTPPVSVVSDAIPLLKVPDGRDRREPARRHQPGRRDSPAQAARVPGGELPGRRDQRHLQHRRLLRLGVRLRRAIRAGWRSPPRASHAPASPGRPVLVPPRGGLVSTTGAQAAVTLGLSAVAGLALVASPDWWIAFGLLGVAALTAFGLINPALSWPCSCFIRPAAGPFLQGHRRRAVRQRRRAARRPAGGHHHRGPRAAPAPLLGARHGSAAWPSRCSASLRRRRPGSSWAARWARSRSASWCGWRR